MSPNLRGAGKLLAVAWAWAAASGLVFAAEQAVTYENTIRKIVADRCLGCHGAGSPSLAEFKKDQKAWEKKFKGPRMDSYETLAAFVNGSAFGCAFASDSTFIGGPATAAIPSTASSASRTGP